ncbi:MAG TPA: phosphatase PAP2 family protein [Gammaproteobacteria bacterium]|nr:phosphatase PAP2 family protein [Gammaproteobacteria bacterium]
MTAFPVRSQLKILFPSILLIILCYLFIDKPVAFWVNAHHLQQYHWLKLLTHLDDVLGGIVFLIYLVLWVGLLLNINSRHDKLLLVIANCYVITAFLVTILKFVFARYWPATWANNNPSLLQNGTYAFNWFHWGIAYSAFPSGHAARVMAAMMAFYLVYRRWRWLAGLVVILTAVSLVSVNYHFVSDVIAGILLGYIVATTTYHLIHPSPFSRERYL